MIPPPPRSTLFPYTTLFRSDREITISRSKYSVKYPAGFMLVAAMNPCPCGYHNHPDRECVCPAGSVLKYLNKIDRKSTRLNSSHVRISYAVFCLKKKNKKNKNHVLYLINIFHCIFALIR